MQRLLQLLALLCASAIAQDNLVQSPKFTSSTSSTAPVNLAGDLVARGVNAQAPMRFRSTRVQPRDSTCYTIRSHSFDESDVPRKTGETSCVRADRNLLKKVERQAAR